MIKFDSNDLNQAAWAQRARDEAALIHGTKSTRGKRSLEEIYQTTKYGHAAEQFLIEQCKFTDDTRLYKDVYDTVGDEVEVKVTEKESWVQLVVQRCNDAAKLSWREFPKKLIIFVAPRDKTVYTLHSYYEYNGKEFVKSSVQINGIIV